MKFGEILLNQYRSRPLWMNGLLFFCGYMTFIYLPWDIFLKPLAEDQEVWFGIMFTGWAAKGGAVLHWLVYGAGTYGFIKMKSWMHPWSEAYVLQIAFSMFIWSYLNSEDSIAGIVVGLVSAALFFGLAAMLWRARLRFTTD
tara:strand:+ start:509 stop:934 length:426 start_codon:yes stop_codon:yes gene_type:complete